MNSVYEMLHSIGIIPVVKINNAENAAALAKALLKGGIPAAEITFRTEQAADAIQRIAEEVPEVCVCAGTVLTVPQAEQAIKAGAKAIISPGINPDVIDWCIGHKIPVIPGCSTPSEVEFCSRKGLKIVKLFPAEVVGGIKMLKALAGPYKEIQFMPTGGINEQNAADYLSLPNVLCCGGSWIVPEKTLDDGNFEAIEELARKVSVNIRK